MLSSLVAFISLRWVTIYSLWVLSSQGLGDEVDEWIFIFSAKSTFEIIEVQRPEHRSSQPFALDEVHLKTRLLGDGRIPFRENKTNVRCNARPIFEDRPGHVSSAYIWTFCEYNSAILKQTPVLIESTSATKVLCLSSEPIHTYCRACKIQPTQRSTHLVFETLHVIKTDPLISFVSVGKFLLIVPNTFSAELANL